MKPKNLSLLIASTIVGFALAQAAVWAQGADERNKKLSELRSRLAQVKEGLTSEQVLKTLGKPDEVRRLPTNDPFEDIVLGALPRQRERWMYGVLAKGRFASIGYVGMDRDGKVVAAMPTDCYVYDRFRRDHVKATNGDRVLESAAKMSCRLGNVELVAAEDWNSQWFKAKVTVKNSGAKRFELKHDASSMMQRFLVIEVYDGAGTLLFREDKMSYHSPVHFDPAKWPTLAIPPGKEIAEEVYFSPANDFGPLPPGKYSARVYFPLEKGKYYPSNLVPFTVMPKLQCRLDVDRGRKAAKIGDPVSLHFELKSMTRDKLFIIYNSNFLEHLDLEVLDPTGKRISKRYGEVFSPCTPLPERMYLFSPDTTMRTGVSVFAACDKKDRQAPGIYKITAIYAYQNEKAVSNSIELTLTAK
jgi:hypothetical protein